MNPLDGAIRFRFLAGALGRRRGRFSSDAYLLAEGCGIAIPLHGRAVVQRGRRRITLLPGMALLTPRGLRQRLSDDGSPEYVQRWARVAFTVFGTVDLFSLITLPDFLIGAAAGEAASQVAELNAAASAEGLDLVAMSRREAAGYRLLRLLVEHGRPVPRLKARLLAIERLQPALHAIQARLSERLDRRTLAREVGASTSRLHALFVAAFDESPYAWLTRLRLRRAQDLLVGSDMAVQDIAAAAGFADAFHFSRSFKRAFGASPREYRRQVRAGW